MRYAIKLTGYVYKLDKNKNYIEFDDIEFSDKLIEYIEQSGLFFLGSTTSVDLDKENKGAKIEPQY